MGTGESNHADSENQRYSAPPPSPRFSVLSSFGFIKRSSHRRVDGKTSDDAQSSRRIRTLDHGISHPPPQRRFASKNSGAHLRSSFHATTGDHATRGSVNDRARRVRFGCFFSSDDPRVSLGRGIARVRPAFDARLAPRRSRDEGGAPNRRDPVRDARQRAEAVRRGKLEGDLRQARAGPRPLQGSLSGQRSVPISDSRARSSTSDPRVAPSSSRRARRRAVSWHPIIFKSAPPSCQLRDLVPTARSSKLAVFPPRDSTGTGGLSRRGRRVLPLRAPRRQPHRQGGRRPRLLETAEEDARVHSTKAGLTRS